MRWFALVAAVGLVAFSPSLVAVAPTSAATPAHCLPASAASKWSLSRLVAAVVVDPTDVGDPAALSSAVAGGIGGILLTGDDSSPSFASSLVHLAADVPAGDVPFVMTDEEGGSVQRLVGLVGNVPSARTMAATMTAAQIEALARRLGTRMRSLGITMDLAPVLDLDGAPGPNNSDADGTRSYSPVESIAANDGVAFAKGLLAAGVAPVMKHFPGLGGASANTDLGPASTKPYTGLGTLGVLPFRVGVAAGLPAVMVANASVPGLSATPASLSSAVITVLLRDRLGFHGLVLTDSLSVPSITATGDNLAAAAVAAVRAGADEVLFNADASKVVADNSAIEAALLAAIRAGSISRLALVTSAARALSLKAAIGSC